MNASSFLSRQTFSVCRSCRRDLLRRFTTSRAPRISFQSYPLSQPPPPAPSPPKQPRRPDIAEASLAYPSKDRLPRLHETRPPKDAGRGSSIGEPEVIKTEPALAVKKEVDSESNPAKNSTSSPAEQQAAPATTSPPKPSSTSTESAASPTKTPSAAKRPSRLRTPRKAAIKLTPAAIEHLRALLEKPTPQLIRVGVRNRGCSGLAYHLEYVDKPGPFDETIEQDGVKVLIDSKALFSIIGSEMDWVEDALQESFKFRNPNIKEQCGCGESFMV